MKPSLTLRRRPAVPAGRADGRREDQGSGGITSSIGAAACSVPAAAMKWSEETSRACSASITVKWCGSTVLPLSIFYRAAKVI